jgi:ligand-binding sensor domain-containing protein
MALAFFFISRGAFAREVYTDTSEVHACVTRDGATVAATGGGVVVTKNGSSRVLTLLDGLPDTRAHALLGTEDGVWVGTELGAVLLSDRFEPIRTREPGTSVRALARWNDDVLAGTFGRGIADLTSGTFITTPDARVLSLSTFDGMLYAATMSGVFARSGSTFAQLSSAPAFGVKLDGSTVRVLSTPEAAGCTTPSNGLPSNDVSAVVADERGTWVGTFDQGLSRLERGRFITMAGVDKRIDALVLDRKSDRVWVGTARGLFAVDDGVGHAVLPGDEVHALAAREGGGVIAGTSHGAVIVDANTIARIGPKQGVDIPSVTAVLEHDGTLFLGTTGGLFIGRGRKFERLSLASGHLPDDWVTALATSGDAIYVGTYNAGVVRLEKGKGWRAVRLGGDYVNPAGLCVDGHTLYVATMDGLWTSTNGSRLTRRDGGALGADVTGVAVSPVGTFVASRRGLLLQ